MRTPKSISSLIVCLALITAHTASAAGPAVDSLDYPGPAWSPYIVGAGIGVLSWLTFYVSDKPIGASSFYAQVAGFIGILLARRYVESLAYFKENPPQVGWGFTVAKIMLTAIIVGMIGIFALHHFAKVNLHIKPAKIGSNIIGGLLFGAGFALMGYCPGTAAAALGQGSWDALFGMIGLVAGSWIYAEFSASLKSTLEKWGDLGKVFLPDLLHVPRSVFMVIFAVMLTVGLFALERAFPR